MTECEQHSPPTEQPAFTFNIRPLHHEKIDQILHLDLPAPTHTNSTYEPFAVSLLAQTNAPIAEGVSSVHRGVVSRHNQTTLSEQHKDGSSEQQPDLMSRVKSLHGLVATMRCTQIQTMLMRCQVLQATIQSIQCRPWFEDEALSIQSHYESMKRIACKAHSLAEGVQERDLQARSAFWADCACKGTGKMVVVLEHLKRAKVLSPGNKDASGGEQRLRWTPKQVEDLDALLWQVSIRSETGKSGHELVPTHPSRRVLEMVMEQESLHIRYGNEMRRDSYRTEGIITLKQELERAISWSSWSEEGSGGLSDCLEDDEAPKSPDWQQDVQEY